MPTVAVPPFADLLRAFAAEAPGISVQQQAVLPGVHLSAAKCEQRPVAAKMQGLKTDPWSCNGLALLRDRIEPQQVVLILDCDLAVVRAGRQQLCRALYTLGLGARCGIQRQSVQGAANLKQQLAADPRHLIGAVRAFGQRKRCQQPAVERVTIELPGSAPLPDCAGVVQHRTHSAGGFARIPGQRCAGFAGVAEHPGKSKFRASRLHRSKQKGHEQESAS